MDYTEIVVILDRSGSMEDRKKDHEGGLRSFVEDQKGLEGDVRFTFIRFDTIDPCEVVYDGVPIEQVGKIELIPRGGTPLLDAVGMGLAHVEKRLKDAKANPDQVVVMVITDGEENSSREWTKAKVADRIKALEKEGWHFLFLAANIDAFSEASTMGIGQHTASGFANSAVGTMSIYAATSANLLTNRADIASGAWEPRTCDRNTNSMKYAYSATQRAAMTQEDEVGTVSGSCHTSPDQKGAGRRRRGLKDHRRA